MRIVPVLLVAGVLATACAPPDREAEIRNFVDEAIAAAEARDAGFFRAHLDEAYVDARGRTRDDVLGLIRAWFLVNRRVEVLSRIERIELDGDDFAVAVLQAALIGSRGGLDVDAELRRLELELARDGSRWTVIGASWEGLDD